MDDKEAVIKCFLEQTRSWQYVEESKIKSIDFIYVHDGYIKFSVSTEDDGFYREEVELLELLAFIWRK